MDSNNICIFTNTVIDTNRITIINTNTCLEEIVDSNIQIPLLKESQIQISIQIQNQENTNTSLMNPPHPPS